MHNLRFITVVLSSWKSLVQRYFYFADRAFYTHFLSSKNQNNAIHMFKANNSNQY